VAGTPNKVTKQVKEALVEALNDGDGAVDFFVKLKNGTSEDRRTFANLCSRLIPHEVTGSIGTPRAAEEISDLEAARSIIFLLHGGVIQAEADGASSSQITGPVRASPS
jgi:hypothetical protein